MNIMESAQCHHFFRDSLLCAETYPGHDLHFTRSRDVIDHVTNSIRHGLFPIGTERLSLTVIVASVLLFLNISVCIFPNIIHILTSALGLLLVTWRSEIAERQN